MNTKKFLNYSHASKLRQAAIDPAIRKQRMSLAARARWSKTTPEERREHSQKMMRAKQFGKQVPHDEKGNAKNI